MRQQIILRYLNPALNIAMADPKTVYLLTPNPVQLYPEVRRGRLVYRAHGSGRRISYNQLKKGLRKQTIIIVQDVPDWL